MFSIIRVVGVAVSRAVVAKTAATIGVVVAGVAVHNGASKVLKDVVSSWKKAARPKKSFLGL